MPYSTLDFVLYVSAVFITGFFCSLAVHIIDKKSDEAVSVVTETKSARKKKYK